MKKNSLVVSSVLLASSIAISSVSWAVSPLNTVNDGRIVKGGTYYNTPGNTTSFINSKSGGLWLKAGTTLRGLEANTNGALTNNGGTVHLYAPDNVVRVDGTLDVNAIRNSQGAYLGNGGKVFIDSAYLFQNGNIFANGVNGGLVQMNVAGMTLGAGAQIQAKGSTGAGGTVAINSSGPVDLRRGSVVDTSGKVLGTLDSNLINIEGGLVNNEGTLRADGINSRGGSIRLVASGQSPYQDIKDNLQAATINPPGDTSTPTITPQERTFLLQRTKSLIDHHEGQVFLSKDTSSSAPSFVSNVSANGAGSNADSKNDYTQNSAPRAGDGGNIALYAVGNIENLGNIRANGSAGRSSTSPVNGGNGGTIVFLTQDNTSNTKGRLEANGGNGGASTSTATSGKGGNGGLIAFGYDGTMTNTGNIYADGALGGNGADPGLGGNGGLIVFSGDNNPTGNGSIDVIARPGGNNNLFLGGKSGTIVSPNPGTLGQAQVYFQQGYVNGQLVRTRATQQTQPVELLTHSENVIMLTKNGGNINVSENLFERLNQARIRSVEDPTGSLGQARTEVINKNTATSAYVYRNLILGSSRDGENRDGLALDISHPNQIPPGQTYPQLILPSPLSRGLGFSTLNTLSIVARKVQNGPYQTSNVGTDDVYFKLWQLGKNANAGGRISILGTYVVPLDYMTTNGKDSGGSINMASTNLSSVTNGGSFGENGFVMTNGTLHSGSIMVKATERITNEDIPFTQSSGSVFSSSGGLMGGTIRMIATEDIRSGSGKTFGEFRTGTPSILANGIGQGGVIDASAGESVKITGNVLANASQGNGGYIRLHGDNSVYIAPQREYLGKVEANGSINGGQIVLTAGDHILGNEGRPSTIDIDGTTPEFVSSFGLRQLTPPRTIVGTQAKLDQSESIFVYGLVNALGGSGGKNGKIYFGANEQIGFGLDGTPSTVLNGATANYNQILASTNRNQAFQNALLPSQTNGGRVYTVVGQALTNMAGQTRNAVDATNEAAPSKLAPNVNPLQNGQGALLPNDFFLPNP